MSIFLGDPLTIAPTLRRAATPAVVVPQRKAWRDRDVVFLYFENNAGLIVDPKSEMKDSAITGSVAKECVSITFSLCSCSSSSPLGLVRCCS